MKLYKYFSKARVAFLQDRLVRFTPPAAFNDPFELSPVVDSAFKKPKKTGKVATGFSSTIQQLQSTLYRQGKVLADNLVNSRALVQSLTSDKFGVLSLSKRRDSLLMWAHYASQHEGFIIEFESTHPWFSQKEFVPGYGNVGFLRKVKYSPERPKIHAKGTAQFGFSKGARPEDIFFAKSRQWAYENEWRIVMLLARATKIIEGATHLFEVPSAAISAVILGARIAPSDQEKIVSHLSNTQLAHVSLIRASLNPRRFILDFRPEAQVVKIRARPHS
jgi:Protein of unknown function (DUF2971)